MKKSMFILFAIMAPIFANSTSALAAPQFQIVRAAKDIKKGSVFKTDELTADSLDADKVPKTACSQKDFFLNRRARSSIPKGTLLCIEHVSPEDLAKWSQFDEMLYQQSLKRKPKAGYSKVFYPVRYIPKGHFVESGLLEEKDIKQSQVPKGAVVSLKQAFGRAVKCDVAQGQILTEEDLNPSKTNK